MNAPNSIGQNVLRLSALADSIGSFTCNPDNHRPTSLVFSRDNNAKPIIVDGEEVKCVRAQFDSAIQGKPWSMQIGLHYGVSLTTYDDGRNFLFRNDPKIMVDYEKSPLLRLAMKPYTSGSDKIIRLDHYLAYLIYLEDSTSRKINYSKKAIVPKGFHEYNELRKDLYEWGYEPKFRRLIETGSTRKSKKKLPSDFDPDSLPSSQTNLGKDLRTLREIQYSIFDFERQFANTELFEHDAFEYTQNSLDLHSLTKANHQYHSRYAPDPGKWICSTESARETKSTLDQELAAALFESQAANGFGDQTNHSATLELSGVEHSIETELQLNTGDDDKLQGSDNLNLTVDSPDLSDAPPTSQEPEPSSYLPTPIEAVDSVVAVEDQVENPQWDLDECRDALPQGDGESKSIELFSGKNARGPHMAKMLQSVFNGFEIQGALLNRSTDIDPKMWFRFAHVCDALGYTRDARGNIFKKLLEKPSTNGMVWKVERDDPDFQAVVQCFLKKHCEEESHEETTQIRANLGLSLINFDGLNLLAMRCKNKDDAIEFQKHMAKVVEEVIRFGQYKDPEFVPETKKKPAMESDVAGTLPKPIHFPRALLTKLKDRVTERGIDPTMYLEKAIEDIEKDSVSKMNVQELVAVEEVVANEFNRLVSEAKAKLGEEGLKALLLDAIGTTEPDSISTQEQLPLDHE